MRSFIAIPVDKQATEALKTYVEILKKLLAKSPFAGFQNKIITLPFIF